MATRFRLMVTPMETCSASSRWLGWRKAAPFSLITVAILITAGSATAQIYIGIDLYTLEPLYQPFNVSSYPSAAAGGQVGGVAYLGPNVQPFKAALLWTPPDGTPADLTPRSLNGFNSGEVFGTDGLHQVGDGGYFQAVGDSKTPLVHAMLWTGTAGSVVDLHPTNLTGFTNSSAYGLGGGQQVGLGNLIGPTFFYSHALLWHGTAESAVDLNPTNLSGFDYGTVAYGTDGTQQVGYGESSTGGTHALLWTGTANSAVDLNPTGLSGIDGSFAEGVGGGQQVGYGYNGTTGIRHAILWRGTADTALDLNPANLNGFTVQSSTAYGTNGAQQVGFGVIQTDNANQFTHAILWSGTADSAVDLNLLLPADLVASTAYTIDAQGDVFGLAYDSDFSAHAVEWVAVPEPASLTLFILSAIVVGRRTKFFVAMRDSAADNRPRQVVPRHLCVSVCSKQ